MKKTKFLILIAALLLAAVCFVACADSQGTRAETTTEPPVTTLPGLTSFDSVKIAGNDLKDYTIVYAESPYVTLATENPDLFPVYDFDKETAERLSDLIFNVTGTRLAVALDVETVPGAKEILIGKTDREASTALALNKVRTDEYLIRVYDSSLVICGGVYGTTWHALDYLEALFNKMLDERTADYEFAADYYYKGNHHMIQIGCIGDSITEGYGIDSANLYAYPVQLGRLLWKDAIVTNFGNSGKTLRNDLNDAYVNTGTYTRALTSASRMDIYTVMLGTNDSDRDQNWNANSTAQFKESCRLLFENLTKKNSDLKFVIANCPAYFGSGKFGSATVRNLQKQLVGEMNELGYPTEFFDMYKVTVKLKSTFEDTLHPNQKGHVEMAKAFAEALDAMINPVEE